jgi:hypothetical protein
VARSGRLTRLQRMSPVALSSVPALPLVHSLLHAAGARRPVHVPVRAAARVGVSQIKPLVSLAAARVGVSCVVGHAAPHGSATDSGRVRLGREGEAWKPVDASQGLWEWTRPRDCGSGRVPGTVGVDACG